ncbi:hypothetical protein ABW20_dc0110019 [Dactylellina cionopaga]|nr:hypothetical protein ABW20_dc0110019 [Dactylellina cionopaga]
MAASASYLKVHGSCIGGLTPIYIFDTTFISSIGRTHIYPVWSTLRLIDATHAAMVCQVADDLTLYRALAMDSMFQRCPRSCLSRVASIAKDDYQLKILAGFEIEFYLITEGENSVIPVKTASHLKPWSSIEHMRDQRADCLESCMLALEAAGIVVEQGHSEGALHQYEICTGPLPLLEAVDSLIFSKEIIKVVALRHGYNAIFIPMPFANREPTGLHLHLSLHTNVDALTPVEELTDPRTRSCHEVSTSVADHFLAGTLNRLPALCAFGMASDNSYQRTIDAMGEYVAWGKANSTVPISEVSTGYWEFRFLDWTANIYLAAAAFVTAGLLGIKNSEAVKMEDPGDITYSLDEATRKKFGITTLLPLSIDDAIIKLIEGRYVGLPEFMGEQIIDLYVLVKQEEVKRLKALSGEDRHTLLMKYF